MEVTQNVVNWLNKIGLLLGNYAKNEDKVTLTEEDSSKVELGLFWPLIKQVDPTSIPIDTKFSESNSSFSRLCNWNIIIKPLERLGISINSDTKALIVAGDRMQVVEVLESFIDSLENTKRKKKLVKTEDGAILLNNIDVSCPLEESESVLEFLILSFCKAFKILPKVAAGLLTQNCNFLTQLIIRGLKGAYDPVKNWYEMMKNQSLTLQKLVENENSSLSLIYTCLNPGFLSKSSEIQTTTAELLTSYHTNLKYLENLSWDWFNSSNDTIFAVFEILSKDTQDILPFLNFLFIFSKKKLDLIFCNKLKEFCESGKNYLKILQKLIVYLKNPPFGTLLFNQNILENWVETGLREVEFDIKNNEGKAISIGFLCDLWAYFPNFIEYKEDLANSMLVSIKRSLRESKKTLKFLVYGQMFNLLSIFAESKNSFAPILYKTLTFVLIENFNEERVREFVLTNFCRIFQELDSIPLGILLEPYIKQAQVSKNLNFGMHDLEFLQACINHNKLVIKDSVLILDLLGRVIINSWLYGRAAVDLFINLVERFSELTPITEFVLKFFRISLKLLFVDIIPAERSTEQFIKKNVFTLIEKIILLEATDLTYEIRELMSYPDIRSIKDKNIQYILNILAIPLPEKPKKLDRLQIFEEEKKILSIHSRPKGRVLDDLEKVKKKRQERENKEKEEQERKTQMENYKKKRLRKQIEKRRIELGVKPKVENEQILQILPEIENFEEKQEFFRICEENSEEQFMIDIVCKKYARVMRVLFSKYAGCSTKKPLVPLVTFDKMQNIKESLSEADFSKLLRENCVSNIMITTDEIKSAFSYILTKNKTHLVTFEHFADLLYIIAGIIFTRDPYNFSQFPQCKIFESFFEVFKTNDEKIIPLWMFDEPDPGYGDREVVKLLNSKLEQNPEFQVPEGYQKYKSADLITEYISYTGTNSEQVAVEILDKIFFNTFGVHLLSPVVRVDYKFRVKGTIKFDDYKLKGINRIESFTGFNHLSSHTKLFALASDPSKAEFLIEIGKIVDDLVYSTEKGSKVLISKHAKAPGTIQNRAIQLKMEKEVLKSMEIERSENKRKQRAALINTEATKIKSEREYKTFLQEESKKQEILRMKFLEQKKKQKREKEKFELEEKILEYKLAKFEKEIKGKNEESEWNSGLKPKRVSALRPKSIQSMEIVKKKERHNSESLPRTLKKLNI